MFDLFVLDCISEKFQIGIMLSCVGESTHINLSEKANGTWT